MKIRENIILAALLAAASTSAYAGEWSVTGDLRERYQSFNNLDFNSATNNNSSEFDSRLYIKAKGSFDNGISVMLQPQAVYIRNMTTTAGVSSHQNLTQSDLLQAYMQYDRDAMSLRLGRQQLVYGDQRLLGHLGWKDVARTFDGIKLGYKQDGLSMDAFAVHPADITNMTPTAAATHGQSLVTWEDRTVAGVYATYTVAPKNGMDAYYINWKHGDQETTAPGRSVNTYGVRLFANGSGFDGTAEYVRQGGTWSRGVSQQASAMAVKAGYTLDAIKTRFGVEYNFSPGDDKANAGVHKDFVFPYHTNHAHYGEMDRFSWANMKDLRFSIKSELATGLTLFADYHMLSLHQAKGDWLNVVGTGALKAGNAAYVQTKAGNELDIKLAYKLNDAWKLIGVYSSFAPGAAVRERWGTADAASNVFLIASYTF